MDEQLNAAQALTTPRKIKSLRIEGQDRINEEAERFRLAAEESAKVPTLLGPSTPRY